MDDVPPYVLQTLGLTALMTFSRVSLFIHHYRIKGESVPALGRLTGSWSVLGAFKPKQTNKITNFKVIFGL